MVALTSAAGKVRAHVRTSFAGSPIGSVTFKEGNVVLGTAAVNGAGSAVFAWGSLTPGKRQITAADSGSGCFLNATSGLFDLIVPA